jgi:hypothetical protein
MFGCIFHDGYPVSENIIKKQELLNHPFSNPGPFVGFFCILGQKLE